MKLSPNELAAETERVRQNNYQQFVKKVRLRNVRGFQDEVIEFRTRVTALIGTNGGGKSTILGSVALAYKNMRPSQFFPKAFIGDESMADWSIEFELVKNRYHRLRRSRRPQNSLSQSGGEMISLKDRFNTSKFNALCRQESRDAFANS
jgi:DNA repair exonuclease SbcCD ATPase subunit